MRRAGIALFLALAGVLAAVPARAELHVSMHDGLVTVAASDVTVRQILAEWARVGQTKIVNAEGVAGGPVTLQIIDMPEEAALAILLRTAAGYLVAPRPVPIRTASHFDRIVITPTSSPVNAPAAAVTPPRPVPQFQQRPQAPFAAADPDDDAPAPPLPGAPPQPGAPGNPAQTTFPQPGVSPALGAPPAAVVPQAPTSLPTTPGGMSAPGTIMPAPPAAGQPGQANQPGQQRPGGR
jgi:hypothetical protein